MEEPRIDPRIKRTRAALREALTTLLRDRGFEDITLGDIAETAGLNRATIYKHHADKFDLLATWITDDLRHRLIEHCMCATTGEAKLRGSIVAACECMQWIASLGRPDDRLLRPIAEARVKDMLMRLVVFSLEAKFAKALVPVDLAAAMTSSAICGAAVAWAAQPRKLEAHVDKTMTALSAIIAGSDKLPTRVTAMLSLD